MNAPSIDISAQSVNVKSPSKPIVLYAGIFLVLAILGVVGYFLANKKPESKTKTAKVVETVDDSASDDAKKALESTRDADYKKAAEIRKAAKEANKAAMAKMAANSKAANATKKAVKVAKVGKAVKKAAKLASVRADPYGAVPGYQIGGAKGLGNAMNITDPNACKALARAKGANVWGHRNASHPSAKYKNSCFFYKTNPKTKYAGNKNDKIHMIGCSVGGNPKGGCPAVPAKKAKKAKKAAPYWKQIGGKLKQVSVSGNNVCGVNSADNIYCKTNLTGGNWYQVHGKLKHVSVSTVNCMV